jgi:hypothetical protein
MSTALAIASVSSVLKDLLINGIIDHDLSSSVGDVTVTALPPDKIPTDTGERSQLNLALYQVTPNQGWRNEGLASRDSNGNRLTNPPLALDLHYLLSAYGARDLHAEILLGVGMQILHETPVLPRDAIRRSLAPPSSVSGGGGLPPDLQQLFTSGLAEQVEQIKITPFNITTEEIYRLWTAFQARYRPSAAYQVTVVLIESQRPTRATLPVLKRGIYVQPFRQPVIERLLSQAKPGDPILDQPILAGYTLVIQGRDLAGDSTVVSVGGISTAPATLAPEQVTARIPSGLVAGIQGVQVIQNTLMGSPPLPHAGVASNIVPFVLRPQIQPISVTNISGTTLRSADITFSTIPSIGACQRVVLLLNQFNPPAGVTPQSYSFGTPLLAVVSPPIVFSPPGVSDQITIHVSGVVPGTYLARLQTDGAESLLGTDASGHFNSPQVVIP